LRALPAKKRFDSSQVSFLLMSWSDNGEKTQTINLTLFTLVKISASFENRQSQSCAKVARCLSLSKDDKLKIGR
jgi:hypothetical protein